MKNREKLRAASKDSTGNYTTFLIFTERVQISKYSRRILFFRYGTRALRVDCWFSVWWYNTTRILIIFCSYYKLLLMKKQLWCEFIVLLVAFAAFYKSIYIYILLLDVDWRRGGECEHCIEFLSWLMVNTTTSYYS